jgi:hypothetical protein
MADTRGRLPQRQAELLRMSDALHSAAAGADWTLLGTHVTALAPQLRALAAHGPWSAAERQAIDRLRAVHDAAFAATESAAREMAARLEQLRGQKDGWIAYAMQGQTESDRDSGSGSGNKAEP